MPWPFKQAISAAGLDNVLLQAAPAERLALSDASFDLVLAIIVIILRRYRYRFWAYYTPARTYNLCVRGRPNPGGARSGSGQHCDSRHLAERYCVRARAIYF
jgi:hypothetical protein